MAARKNRSWRRVVGGFAFGKVLAAHSSLGWAERAMSRKFLRAVRMASWAWLVLLAGNVCFAGVDSGVGFFERFAPRTALQASASGCASGSCRAVDAEDSESSGLQRSDGRESWSSRGRNGRTRRARHGALSAAWSESGGRHRRLLGSRFGGLFEKVRARSWATQEGSRAGCPESNVDLGSR